MRLPIFSFALILFACTPPIKYNEVKTNDQYSISLPDYMAPASDMHPQASLQYQNPEKELYIVVVDESKEQMQAYDLNYDLETYYKNIVSTPFSEQLKNGKVSMPARMDIDGNKAFISEITGNINNADIYYKLAIIESPTHFYQLVLWTKNDYKEKMSPVMEAMIESFKEIKKGS